MNSDGNKMPSVGQAPPPITTWAAANTALIIARGSWEADPLNIEEGFDSSSTADGAPSTPTMIKFLNFAS